MRQQDTMLGSILLLQIRQFVLGLALFCLESLRSEASWQGARRLVSNSIKASIVAYEFSLYKKERIFN
jgi:hypothetical protein